jgi:hypothetical protein
LLGVLSEQVELYDGLGPRPWDGKDTASFMLDRFVFMAREAIGLDGGSGAQGDE